MYTPGMGRPFPVKRGESSWFTRHYCINWVPVSEQLTRDSIPADIHTQICYHSFGNLDDTLQISLLCEAIGSSGFVNIITNLDLKIFPTCHHHNMRVSKTSSTEEWSQIWSNSKCSMRNSRWQSKINSHITIKRWHWCKKRSVNKSKLFNQYWPFCFWSR